jgi:hypothetical protein
LWGLLLELTEASALQRSQRICQKVDVAHHAMKATSKKQLFSQMRATKFYHGVKCKAQKVT